MENDNDSDKKFMTIIKIEDIYRKPSWVDIWNEIDEIY